MVVGVHDEGSPARAWGWRFNGWDRSAHPPAYSRGRTVPRIPQVPPGDARGDADGIAQKRVRLTFPCSGFFCCLFLCLCWVVFIVLVSFKRQAGVSWLARHRRVRRASLEPRPRVKVDLERPWGWRAAAQRDRSCTSRNIRCNGQGRYPVSWQDGLPRRSLELFGQRAATSRTVALLNTY